MRASHRCNAASGKLMEETGYRAAEWARAGILHNAIAYSNEGIEVWFARGLVAGERRLDDGEFLDIDTATLDELDDLARRGELDRREDAHRHCCGCSIGAQDAGRSNGGPHLRPPEASIITP